MEIKFSTSKLEALCQGDKKIEIKSWLHSEIIRAYRKAIYFLSSAESKLDIKGIWGYNLEKYKDHWSMRLNDKRRLEIDFINWGIQVIDILQISNHYWNYFR